ncbi:MAG TPA: CPBP family intramembrane glutamic endopeptidase [Microbacteriaceae bacterium]|nr:CPBP family intramembrane glutamic endopeptidase [Microbacteriaceae bacterium]
MRRRLTLEIVIVLGLSLGQSAVYSTIALADRLTRQTALADQVAVLNPSRSSRELLDLLYQLLGIGFALVPVALACYLLWSSTTPRLGRLGVDFQRPGRDTLAGLGLALGIGVTGIGVYLVGRALGLTVAIDPAGLGQYWWTIPVLVLAAARAGIEEEMIAVGYLVARLRDLGWRDWPIILLSAGLRGAYHLYQGIGPGVGNFLMGLVFGWLYVRGPAWFRGRTLPLVIAHFAIDAVAFTAYPLAAGLWPELFGLPA